MERTLTTKDSQNSTSHPLNFLFVTDVWHNLWSMSHNKEMRPVSQKKLIRPCFQALIRACFQEAQEVEEVNKRSL